MYVCCWLIQYDKPTTIAMAACNNKQTNIREEAKTAWVSKGIGIGYPNDRSALLCLLWRSYYLRAIPPWK